MATRDAGAGAALPGLARMAPLVLFLGLGSFVIVLRDGGVHEILTGKTDYLLPFDVNGLPTSLRVGSAMMERGLRGLFGIFAHLVMGDPSAYPLFPGSPWGFGDRGSRLDGLVVPLLARASALLLLLAPVLWAASAFFRNTGSRLLYLTAVMATLGGGAPLVVNAFFSLLQPMINWPRSYFMWDVRTYSHDLAAVGMVHLLALTLQASQRIGAGRAALIAAFGQMFFENLGLATGLCLAAAAFALPSGTGPRWRHALARLVGAGLGSVAMLGGLMLLARLNTEKIASSRLNSLADYAHHYWTDVGQYNFMWLNVSLANLATIFVFPAIAGMACGLVAALAEPRVSTEGRWRDVAATLLPMAAVLVTVLLGLANSTWEPARQALAASTMMLLLSASVVRGLVSARGR